MRLPAEWEEQSFVQLTWPHEDSDWADILDEAEACFLEIAKQISIRQKLLIVSKKEILQKLSDFGCDISNIKIANIESNDTWARDHGGITTINKKGKAVINDFIFNGWGLKFAADKDNLITSKLFEAGFFKKAKYRARTFSLEGGGIESDGAGVVMTTEHCLLSKNRNLGMSKEEIEEKIKKYFSAKKVLWLKNGHLEGDDTDSHIDTIARFTSKDTIVYQGCDDENDSHFKDLQEMKKELEAFTNLNCKSYNLIALPFPKAKYDEDGERLPATYANFLIMNSTVLMPIYSDESDSKALEIMQSVYPDKEIVGIDCSVLIKEHGSLHCVTMQFPKEVCKC